MAADAGKKPGEDPKTSPLEGSLKSLNTARRQMDEARQVLVLETATLNHCLRQFLTTLLGEAGQGQDWMIVETEIRLDEATGMVTITNLPISQERPDTVNILAACSDAGYQVNQHSQLASVFDLTIPLSEFERLGVANNTADQDLSRPAELSMGTSTDAMAAMTT